MELLEDNQIKNIGMHRGGMEEYDGIIVESTVQAVVSRGLSAGSTSDASSIHIPCSDYRQNEDQDMQDGEQSLYDAWWPEKHRGGEVVLGGLGNNPVVGWSVDSRADSGERNTVTVTYGDEVNIMRMVKVRFDVPVLPSCGLMMTPGFILHVAAVTADGYVHDIAYSVDEAAAPNVSSVPLPNKTNDHKPTCVALLQDEVCVSTDTGSVFCFKLSDSKLNGQVHHLSYNDGILGHVASYFGSFWGGSNKHQQKLSGIECMKSIRVLVDGDSNTSSELLCSLHSDSTLRIWDIESKSLVHSVALLPSEQMGVLKPVCLDFSPDVLHKGGIFLIVAFEDYISSDSQDTTSNICLFEMNVQNRGGVLNAHMENGPQLPSVAGSILSASLEFVDANGYRLWFVAEKYTSDGEVLHEIECVAFRGDSSGNHQSSSFFVESLEAQLANLVASTDVEENILKMYFDEIHTISSTSDMPTFNLGHYAVAEVFSSPGMFSKSVMLATLARLGFDARHLTRMQDAEIQSCVEDWISSEPDDSMTLFSKCSEFLRGYKRQIALSCPALSVLVLQECQRGDCAVVVVRGQGKISMLFQDLDSDYLRNHKVSSFLASMAQFISPPVTAFVRFAQGYGADLKKALLPAMVRVLSGKSRVNSVEFGSRGSLIRTLARHFSLVVQSFESDMEAICGIIKGKSSHVLSGEYSKGILSTDTLQLSMMKSSIYSCASSEANVILNVLAVLEYLSEQGNGSQLQQQISESMGMFLNNSVSCWVCSSVLFINEESNKQATLEPLPSSDVHISKRMKTARLGKRCQIFDLVSSIDRNFTQQLEAVDSILSIQRARGSILQGFRQKMGASIEAIIHSVMRNAVSNKMDIVQSLLCFAQGNPEIQSIECQFFNAYLLSKRCSESSHHNLLMEKQSLGILLGLCDGIEQPQTAQKLLECLRSVDKAPKMVAETLSEEEYIVALVDIFDQMGCPTSMVTCGMISARLQESLQTKEGMEKSARSWTRVFKSLEDNGDIEEAYIAALSNPDAKRQVDCLKLLVEKICSSGAIESLCTLPMMELRPQCGIHVLDEITRALWDRALKESIEGSKTYFILFDFYVSRGNFQSAASALMSYCRRMSRESISGALDSLLSIQKALTMAIGCLNLVKDADAWIEDSFNPPDLLVRRSWNNSSLVKTEYAIPNILTVQDMEKELAIVKGLIQVVSLVPDFDINNDAQEIVYQLSMLGLYEDAWNLLECVFESTDSVALKESIVHQMSSVATKNNDMVGWRWLKAFLQKETADAVADRLRLAAAEAVLEKDANMNIPPWLLEPYLSRYNLLSSNSVPANHKVDSPGMIRLLLKYGRIETAGHIALEFLSPIVTAVPSVTMHKVGSVYVPHDLMDNVIESLKVSTRESESGRILHDRLLDAVTKIREGSVAQSSVLENILSS